MNMAILDSAIKHALPLSRDLANKHGAYHLARGFDQTNFIHANAIFIALIGWNYINYFNQLHYGSGMKC